MLRSDNARFAVRPVRATKGKNDRLLEFLVDGKNLSFAKPLHLFKKIVTEDVEADGEKVAEADMDTYLEEGM